jgi:hypothetical protein
VVVASGRGGTDALAAASLAGSLGAPVLLTDRDEAPTATVRTLTTLGADRVIVLGGEAAVSPAAFAQLTAGRSGTRVQGADRYATAVDVMRTAAPRPSTVFLARGDVPAGQVPADALAVSPLAYRSSTPVLLTEHDRLPATTASAIVDAGVTTVVVLGGPAAVGAGVVEAVDQLPGVSVQRIAGEDRSGTAAALADTAVASAGFSTKQVGVANGTSIDALSAGPVAGKAGYPLLLSSDATELGGGARRYLAAHAATLTSTVVFGGEAAVTPALLAAARSAADSAVAPPEVPAPEVVPAPSNGMPGASGPAAAPGAAGGSGSPAADPGPKGSPSGAAVTHHDRFYLGRGEATLRAYDDDLGTVDYTLTAADTFSRDGLEVSRTRFQESWGTGLAVHTTSSGRRFDARQEQVPGGGLAPSASLSEGGATVEVSYAYQPEVEQPLHAVHFTTDDPDATDALWHAAYRTTTPVLDEETRRWTLRVAAPDVPGRYTYRVMTNLGGSRYVWAWGHGAEPVSVTVPGARADVRYTGEWIVDHVTDTAVTASQGDVTHDFALEPASGSVPADSVDLLEDVVTGALLSVDYREGAPDNLLALTRPAVDGWRLAAKDLVVDATGDEVTISWTNPHGRALTGVRVLDATWWFARQGADPDFRRLAASTDPEQLRAGEGGSLTFARPDDPQGGRQFHVVLDGTRSVSSISAGQYLPYRPSTPTAPTWTPVEVPLPDPPMATSSLDSSSRGDGDSTAAPTSSASPTSTP